MMDSCVRKSLGGPMQVFGFCMVWDSWSHLEDIPVISIHHLGRFSKSRSIEGYLDLYFRKRAFFPAK
jgi:hypothetical protein